MTVKPEFLMPSYRFEGVGEWVDLDADRLRWCWSQGALMRHDALKARVRDRHAEGAGARVTEAQAVALHAFGVMGEWAASVALGIDGWVPKSGVFLRESDVGLGVDVRTASVASYGLRIRAREPNDRVAVLVLLHEIPDTRPRADGLYRPGRALVVGWISIREARAHPEWVQDFGTGRERCPTVPQSALAPITTLRAKLFPTVDDVIPSIVTRVTAPALPEGVPEDLAARIRMGYVRSDDSVRCRWCRCFSTDQTTLHDFASWLHGPSCPLGYGFDAIRERQDALLTEGAGDASTTRPARSD